MIPEEINEYIKADLATIKARKSFGSGPLEKLYRRAWPFYTVRMRKRRMRKKVLKNPLKYLRGRPAYWMAISLVSSYLRHRMQEESFAAKLFPGTVKDWKIAAAKVEGETLTVEVGLDLHPPIDDIDVEIKLGD